MLRLSSRLFARVAALAIMALALNIGATAQISEHRLTFDIGGGVTPMVGAIGNRLTNGWHFAGGAGFQFSPPFSLGVKAMYNSLGVSQSVLSSASVPSGDAHLFSLTAEPKIRLNSRGKVAPYFVGGVGWYRRTVNFTQPTLTSVTLFDPFYGVLFPGVIPANQVIGSVTRDGIGGNLGAGFDFGFRDVKLFTEARYHYASAGPVPTRMVPVTFGLRF